MSELTITNENYESLVLNSAKPVLLDFWASWCGPCRMVAPLVEQIAQKRQDIVVGKVNVDEEPALAAQFGITSIPTLVVMKNGKITATALGYRPMEQIEALLED